MANHTEGFLHQIVGMLPSFHAEEERLDRETGRRFSVFDLFRTDEPAINRLLDVLLDPKGSHGQGDLFLRLFINRFVPEWRDTFSCGQAKPVRTRELIDVAISDDEHWLGIENKVFGAQEQKQQTDRYLDALKHASSQSRSGDYRLVYLSPQGDAPTGYSFTKEGKKLHPGRLTIGAWVKPDLAAGAAQENATGKDAPNVVRTGTISDWLLECEKECHADNVRWIFRQLQALVHKKLVQGDEISMAGNAIVELALRSVDNLDAALRIGGEYQRIRENVAATVLSDVQRRIEQWIQQHPGDWELNIAWPGGNWVTTPAIKWYPILLRRKAWPSLLGAALVPNNPGPKDVGVGVWAPTQSTWDGALNDNAKCYGSRSGFIDDNQKQAIAVALKMAKQEPWWVDWHYLRDADGKDISDWTTVENIKRLHLKSNELAKQIVGGIGALAETVDGAMG